MIASKHILRDKLREPIIKYNAVTLSSDKVTIKAVENNDWKITLPKEWVCNSLILYYHCHVRQHIAMASLMCDN